MPRPWGTDDSMTKLGAPGLQKGVLPELLSALPLKHLPGLTLHKLVLRKGDFPDKTFGILTSRG
jgi:hypothetical protein